MKLKNKKKVGIEYHVFVKRVIPEEIKRKVSRIHAEAIMKSIKNDENEKKC